MKSNGNYPLSTLQPSHSPLTDAPPTIKSSQATTTTSSSSSTSFSKHSASQPLLYEGLTTERAKEILLEILQNELDTAIKTRKKFAFSSIAPSVLKRLDLWISLLHVCFCIGFVASTQLWTPLVDVLVLSLFIVLNLIFIYIDFHSPSSMVIHKAQHLKHVLKKIDLHPRNDFAIPVLPTLSMHTVFRDHTWHNYPSIFLVENDLIELRFGESAPAPCVYIFEAPCFQANPPSLMLEPGESFRPSFFHVTSSFSDTEPMSMMETELPLHATGRFRFKLLASPLQAHLKHTLTVSTTHRPPWFHFQFFFNLLVGSVYICSLVVHLVTYFLWLPSSFFSIWFPLLHAMGPVLPVIPFFLPFSFLIFRVFSNAYLHVLWNALQSSKTMYATDDDQFDVEAAPPTKDIRVTFRQLFRQWVHWDTSMLPEILGRITVMCFLDREGTLVEPYPSITHVYLPGGAQLDLTDSGYFEDPNWDEYLPLLKPLGLACLAHCPIHACLKPSLVHPCIRHAMTKETCFCLFSKRVGFLVSPLTLHSKKDSVHAFSLFAPYVTEEKHVSDALFEIPWVTWVQWSASGTATPSPHHALVCGHPDLLLPLCLDAWKGSDLESISPGCQEDILSWHSLAWMNDQQVLAFAYAPFFQASGAPPSHTHPFTMVSSGTKMDPRSPLTLQPPSSSQPAMVEVGPGSTVLFQYDPTPPACLTDLVGVPQSVFLGMLSFEHVPKPDVCDVIEDLKLAGIRFVYFSPCNERQTKAFGERLGLDTDWNACILLSEPGDLNASNGYVELTDIKAQLPRGIPEIHTHLQQVDDIPLHVSLFAESTALKMASMIHLFQDHHDVVCCLGSTLSLHHTQAFSSANVAIGIHPIPITSTLLKLASECLSLACALRMHQDTSLYALIQLIREARTLCWSGRQALVFWWSSLFAFAFYLLLIHVCYLDVAKAHVYQLFYVMYYVQLPILAATFLMAPNDPSTMKQFTERSLFRHLHKQIKYLAVRWLIPVLVTIYVHVHFTYHLEGRLPFQSPSLEKSTAAFTHTWIVALFVWTLWMLQLLLASSTFLHRTHALWQASPIHNWVWSVVTLIFLLVQCVCAFVLIPWSVWQSLPWPIYTVFLASLPIQLWVHEKVKSFDHKQWIRFQKRSKLEFNTRLGMHSPV